MPKRTDIFKILIISSVCMMAAIPGFACWQTGHGYDAVRANHLTFVYSQHGKPVAGARFELHKANWADGAPDDQSDVLQGTSRLARWQSTILSAGVTDEMGAVDLGEVSIGKYYVVAVRVTSRKKEEIEGFPIEVLLPFPTRRSQTVWLNYYYDGCTEIFATDPGVHPQFTEN